MTAIVGIVGADKTNLAHQMLNKMSHRGNKWSKIIEGRHSTLGLSGSEIQKPLLQYLNQNHIAQDGAAPHPCTQAKVTSDGVVLKRDPVGINPLYYGWTPDHKLCFASEVKALLIATPDVHELPSGCTFDGNKIESYYQLAEQEPVQGTPDQIAKELRRRLEGAVESSIGDGNVGSWLSGGLDSSIIAALARPHVKTMHSFAAGLAGAPDLVYAKQMADHLGTTHHEIAVTPQEIFSILPEVIYHLESFDALLVRSSIFHYLAAKYASDYVPAAFSGEGGDELFAGYEYLKAIQSDRLPAELVDITKRLHNTALQRVDRCAAAHGMVAHVSFLHPTVLEYALRVPSNLKLCNGVEKWILRHAAKDILPPAILNRPKAKFWQGAGVEDVMLEKAKQSVSTRDFQNGRDIGNGQKINSKEEFMYYQIFNEFFREVNDIKWMGRTKGAPVE